MHRSRRAVNDGAERELDGAGRPAMILEAEITPGMAVGDVVDLARLVEDVGFDRLGISDVALQQDCFAVLAACAMATRRVALGPMVTNPYARHPAVTAAAIASVHELSEGRAFLGLGVGAGLEPLGIDYVQPARTLRSAVVAIRRLLAGDGVTQEGTVFRLDGARLLCPPSSPVPISIGTRSPAVMRLAGEVADIALVGARYLSPALAEQYRAWLAEGAARAGRDPASIEMAPRMTLCVSRDGALARRSVKRYVAHYLALIRPPELDISDERMAAIEAALARASGWYFDHDRFDPPELDDLITDEMVDRFAIAGTADACAAHAGRLRTMGFTSVSMNLAAVRRDTLAAGLRETIENFADVIGEFQHSV
jgi:5,10-methylenetetrahydromethanopterin reductase